MDIDNALVGSGGRLAAQVGLNENVTFEKEYEIDVKVHPFAISGKSTPDRRNMEAKAQ